MPAKSCIMDKAFELHLTIQYGIELVVCFIFYDRYCLKTDL